MAKIKVHTDAKQDNIYFDATSGWVANGHWAIKRNRFLTTFKMTAKHQSLIEANTSFSYSGFNKHLLTGDDCDLPNIERVTKDNTPHTLEPTDISVDSCDLYKVVDRESLEDAFPFAFVASHYSDILLAFPKVKIAEPAKHTDFGSKLFTGLIKCYNSVDAEEDDYDAVLMPALPDLSAFDQLKDLSDLISVWKANL